MSNKKERMMLIVKNNEAAKSRSSEWFSNLKTMGRKGLLCSSSLALKSGIGGQIAACFPE